MDIVWPMSRLNLKRKKSSEKIEVIISRKALGELLKLLPEAEEEVQFGRFENFVFFRVDAHLLAFAKY